ncbi:hypothetical protein [Streptosporangium lutulentum]|uniref:Uncharacterized protein n=1 Tax=Streptosporangium lutulentum TaxID=1461250 RepID=A0ABT9QHF4_9ACTN|nr:hypothetical protein [Streptosporangium lutulentum]MDP9845364.1 hypothetical protein [Streptosporangium lutulentum]
MSAMTPFRPCPVADAPDGAGVSFTVGPPVSGPPRFALTRGAGPEAGRVAITASDREPERRESPTGHESFAASAA